MSKRQWDVEGENFTILLLSIVGTRICDCCWRILIYVGSYFRLNHESLKRVQSRTKFIEIHIGIPFSLEDKLKLIRFISEHRLSILTSNVKIRKFYIPDLFSNNFPIANYPFSIQLLRNKSSVIKTFLRLFPRRGDQFLSAYFYNIHSSSYLLVFVSNHSYP